uniref:L-dopachrome isomerase n=1 Tax=Sipha flava TaxID=143950 RepID=A0A2S2R4I0_9HEMI
MSYTIDTNLPSDQIPDDFLPGMSEFLCTLFDRPRKVIIGQLRAGQVFDFSGSTDPCAVIHMIRGFQYLSKLNEQLIERFVAAISEHVENRLGIPKSRLMIFYYQNDLALIANDGKTLKRIWAEIGVPPPAE